MRKVVSAALAAVALVGCATTATEAGAGLGAGEWRVTQLGSAAAIPNSRAQIAFGEDGRFSGNASCNRMFGNYRVERSTLSLNTIGLTRMLCEHAEMAQERALVALLEQVESYRIHAEELVLTTRSGARIVARRPT